jgi:hypothetical protein
VPWYNYVKRSKEMPSDKNNLMRLITIHSCSNHTCFQIDPDPRTKNYSQQHFQVSKHPIFRHQLNPISIQFSPVPHCNLVLNLPSPTTSSNKTTSLVLLSLTNMPPVKAGTHEEVLQVITISDITNQITGRCFHSACPHV